MLQKIKNKALRKKNPPLDNYLFSIDATCLESIAGWAKNTKVPEHAPVIDVFVNQQLVWQAKCENFRKDLSDKNIGDYAFTLVPDLSILKESCEQIEIRIDGHPLPQNYPFFYNKPLSPAPTNKDPVLKSKDIICYINSVTATTVIGWAKIKNDDNSRLHIELKDDKYIYASGVASAYRKDLADCKIGDACYAFELSIDVSQFESETVECEVFANGVKALKKKYVLKASTKEIENARFMKKFGPQVNSFQEELDLQMAIIKNDIKDSIGSESALTNLVNYTLQSIGQLNTRLSIMEKAMLKHLKGPDK